MSSTQLTAPQAVRARARGRSLRAVHTIPDAPWTPADRLVTASVIVAGALLILVAWIGASDTTDWDAQLGWTALSMAGVVVVCMGVGIWLFRGFARVRSEARAVRGELAMRVDRHALPAADDIRGGARRVTVAGMTHHHSPDCLLVRGKNVVAVDSAGDRPALAPCGVCAG